MEDFSNVGMKGSEESEAVKTMRQKSEESLNFYRRAFCVDGDVSFLNPKDYDKLKIKAVVELNDSKRGKFFVGILGSPSTGDKNNE